METIDDLRSDAQTVRRLIVNEISVRKNLQRTQPHKQNMWKIKALKAQEALDAFDRLALYIKSTDPADRLPARERQASLLSGGES